MDSYFSILLAEYILYTHSIPWLNLVPLSQHDNSDENIQRAHNQHPRFFALFSNLHSVDSLLHQPSLRPPIHMSPDATPPLAVASPFRNQFPSVSTAIAIMSHYASNVQFSSSTSTLRSSSKPLSLPVLTTIAEPDRMSPLDKAPETPTCPATPPWDRKRSLSTSAARTHARDPSEFILVRPPFLPLYSGAVEQRWCYP